MQLGFEELSFRYYSNQLTLSVRQKHLNQIDISMFNEDGYYSQQEDNFVHSANHINDSNVLVPSSGSDFNQLTEDGETLIKLMKERGFQLSEKEAALKSSQKEKEKPNKPKKKGAYFDGQTANLGQLTKALNKALANSDSQLANCILGHILDKKLTAQDRNRYGLMKCGILYELGAYNNCSDKAELYLEQANDLFTIALYSNYIAKSKAQTNDILPGYLHLLRAKALILQLKNQNHSHQSLSKNTQFQDSEIDTLARQIDHTSVDYDIKMANFKAKNNLIHPNFSQFRNRKILKVVCGDYHALVLVGPSLSQQQPPSNCKWATEVFGLGENSSGQITGKPTQTIFKEPLLIAPLSGKNIVGLAANKESSMAYDAEGNIYEWGVTRTPKQSISITFRIGQQIQQLEKGYHHYTLLTKSKKFYVWGEISCKGTLIYKQLEPCLINMKTKNFSCGNSHIIVINSAGEAFGMGSNQLGQLGIKGQLCCKQFKRMNHYSLNRIRKVQCISDCSFFINQDEEMFLCGKYSYNKQSLINPRQVQFPCEIKNIISLSGSIGKYYVTNQKGELYIWEVDSSVKFKLQRTQQKLSQRYISANKSTLLRIRSGIEPKLCKVQLRSSILQSYSPIAFAIELRDSLGLFGNADLVNSPRFQIVLSRSPLGKDQLLKENKLFLQNSTFSDNPLHLNEIIDMRLYSYKIQVTQQPWIWNLEIVSHHAGQYFFAIILQRTILYSSPLTISASSKQREVKDNSASQEAVQEQERKKKELEMKRLREQREKKEAIEDERRRETQKRAEQALKQHIKQQQAAKEAIQKDRKARKELQTGGGYDLSKLKAKLQPKIQKQQSKRESKDELKNEIKPELKNEFKHEFKRQFKKNFKHESKIDSQSEQNCEAKGESNYEIKSELKHEIQYDMTTSSKSSIRATIKKEKMDLMATMKSEKLQTEGVVKNEKQQMGRSTDSFMKSSESFLPNINMRPNSRRKLNLPKPSDQRDKGLKIINTGEVRGQSGRLASKEVPGKLQGKVILRRGLSKGKKP